jgi:DDE superfamily endonuclease
VDFLLTAKRDLGAAQRFFRKMLQEEPLLSPDRIGTDGAGAYPPAITAARKDGLLPRTPVHYVTKHLQQGIESDHFRVIGRELPTFELFALRHATRVATCLVETARLPNPDPPHKLATDPAALTPCPSDGRLTPTRRLRQRYQFVTLRRWRGMWWRRSWLSLNGTIGIQGRKGGALLRHSAPQH